MRAHSQTLIPYLRPLALDLPYQRWRGTLADGDFFDCDALIGDVTQPTLILFHGLEGCSRSHYARRIAHYFWHKKWTVVVPHFRSCSGTINLRPRFYHSGDALEIADMVSAISAHYQPQRLFTVGVSLGGNALLRALGEGFPLPLVERAAAICAPLDLWATGLNLQRGLGRIYDAHFLRALKRKARKKWLQFPDCFERQSMEASRNLMQFDDAVTAPLHGYRSVADYWQRASAKWVLPLIQRPTLLINTHNDPMVPFASIANLAHSASVQRLNPRSGGHVGFELQTAAQTQLLDVLWRFWHEQPLTS